jgi:hypothetical protein
LKITISFLRYHWGDWYDFEIRDGQYTATAKFGTDDVLTADTAEALRGRSGAACKSRRKAG